MPDCVDAQGQPIAAAGAESARQFDIAVNAYLGARLDTRERLGALLAADPSCVMGHCLDGYLHMLSSKRPGFQHAADALSRAQVAAVHPTGSSPRERSHLGALAAWSRGDLRTAVRHWDTVLAECPRDLVALKVSQFVLAYLGESSRMHETVARVLPAWDAAVPGYGFVLGCYAYALEEAGEYQKAEGMGRRAVEINPGDIWAAHAVAHVAEMQGRLHDGLDWISTVSGHWSQCNNFTYHLRWHEALFHLDLEGYDRVLELYDSAIRSQPTDEYLDVANAVSLLWRLEQADVDVDARWNELADRARGHLSDHALVFVDLHYLMALAAVSDTDAIARFVESCERFARTDSGTEATVMADVGLSLVRAVIAHRRGDFGKVVRLLMPIRRQFKRIGGSHAQRDLFDQLLIDAARRAHRLDVAAELLLERTHARPRNIWGWREYVGVLGAQGAPAAAAAGNTLDFLRSH